VASKTMTFVSGTQIDLSRVRFTDINGLLAIDVTADWVPQQQPSSGGGVPLTHADLSKCKVYLSLSDKPPCMVPGSGNAVELLIYDHKAFSNVRKASSKDF
jgi:hypothetical protein